MTGNAISKRAWELSDLGETIKSVWRQNEGFCENFFRIITYLIPFVPGLGWGVFILEKIATFFGYGLSDLGKAIDNAMGWAPNTNLQIQENDLLEGIGGFLKNLLKPSVGATENDIIKLAWFGGLLKLIGAIPKLIQILWKAVKFLLLAVGLTKIGDIYAQTSGTTKLPGQLYLEDTNNHEIPESKDFTDENLEGLMSFVADPSQLMQPFTRLM
jgi:hypothetical protein